MNIIRNLSPNAKINIIIPVFVITSLIHSSVMLTETIHLQARNHRQFYEFLPVLNEDQIVKLRNIVIGTKNASAFSEEEINELKQKLRQLQTYSR